MLKSLSITNYALIENLQVDFNSGFSIITGETGAGKSILLGGLSLVLGKRADLSHIKDTSKKCIVEANFDIAKYSLKQWFIANDLDFDVETILRREILPSGKSRAFINDSPVTLSTIKQLGEKLIDIHSQHETLLLTSDDFQFLILDALAKNKELLFDYTKALTQLKEQTKAYNHLLQIKSEAIKEHDYNSFLLNELVEANIEDVDVVSLEETYEELNNVEEIKNELNYTNQILSEEEIGVLENLRTLKNSLQKIASFSELYQNLYERVDSVFIELDDIGNEIQNAQDNVQANPELLDEVSNKLQQLQNLFSKHSVSTNEDLIEIKQQIESKVNQVLNIDAEIESAKAKTEELTNAINKLADKISKNRKQIIPELQNQLKTIVSSLGMEHAIFDIQLSKVEEFLPNGKDKLQFLFSANKGSQLVELKKVASGGELSRIMLAIKSILVNYEQLPTIMFDEIDSGVSGEISNKMAEIMLKMSKNLQVFAITHSPQIAAKGQTHFKVFKDHLDKETITNLQQLQEQDRVVEIAQMLSGKQVSASALEHAKQLLN